MSADRQRLVGAIRRIAKTDPEIRGLLDAADNKGGKPGAAGVGGGQGEGKEDQICCDGTEGEPTPGVDERNPEDGGQTGLDPDDPADIGDQGPGTLDGVTDCATGQPICFDGGGFIPPDGWDEPDDPPVDPEYIPSEDQFWADFFDATDRPHSRTKGQIKDILRAKVIEPNGYTFKFFETDSTDTVKACYLETCGVFIEVNLFNCPISGSVGDLYCGNQFGFPTEDEYLEEDWPSDGCVNLAIINGTIVGSKYDPENDGSYSAPRSSIDLCSGADQISLAPAASGGWKTINSTTDNGYLYDSSGKQIAHIDGNEYSDPSV